MVSLSNRVNSVPPSIIVQAGHVGTEGNELADRMATLGVHSEEKKLRLYKETMDIMTLLNMRAG